MVASTPALEIVEKYHNAWTTGDLDGAMDYVADDVTVHAPGEEITGKDAYREYLGGFMTMLTGLTNLASFGDDTTAVLYYFPHTPFTQTAPTAEFFTVADGKISESHLVFDRMSFGPPPEQD
jgi:ketosteroid isomerase-like protein